MAYAFRRAQSRARFVWVDACSRGNLPEDGVAASLRARLSTAFHADDCCRKPRRLAHAGSDPIGRIVGGEQLATDVPTFFGCSDC